MLAILWLLAIVSVPTLAAMWAMQCQVCPLALQTRILILPEVFPASLAVILAGQSANYRKHGQLLIFWFGRSVGPYFDRQVCHHVCQCVGRIGAGIILGLCRLQGETECSRFDRVGHRLCLQTSAKPNHFWVIGFWPVIRQCWIIPG